MKKQDLLIVVLLFAAMLAWPTMYRRLAPKLAPAREEPTKPSVESPGPVETEEANVPEYPKTTVAAWEGTVETEAPKTLSSGQRFLLSNDFLKIEISSGGACAVSAELAHYRAGIDPASGPVRFEFATEPALLYSRLPGFSPSDEFDVSSSSERSLVLERTNDDGTRFKRTIVLGDDYEMKIEDAFANDRAEPVAIPQHLMCLGPMSEAGSPARSAGQHNFGVDVLPSASGEGVKHWASSLPGFFKTARKERKLARLPETIGITTNIPADWIAAKDKFFVQILEPDTESIGYMMRAERLILPGEGEVPGPNPKNAEIKQVSASLVLPAFSLDPGQEFVRRTSYYIGPKKLSILQKLGLHKDQIMEFGWWSPVCKILLRVLNAMYSFIPSYGIAILLLTVLIRVVFWPLTHKSAESMKKMQALQPEMMELKKKHKNNPKLMQAETMALYKKNKVNPMSGCLPMIIQIPVFIALFVVLRSAIELRFAHFLWIKDLSQPERLFSDVLPIPLNILPIVMAITMAWQQMLTPASDPSQQKLMSIFMPAMMLVMFYNMPSALVLYWSASQCMMIGQQLIQKKRAALEPAALRKA